eukprot:4955563-Pyramimonas_sp.AAC.1
MSYSLSPGSQLSRKCIGRAEMLSERSSYANARLKNLQISFKSAQIRPKVTTLSFLVGSTN